MKYFHTVFNIILEFSMKETKVMIIKINNRQRTMINNRRKTQRRKRRNHRKNKSLIQKERIKKLELLLKSQSVNNNDNYESMYIIKYKIFTNIYLINHSYSVFSRFFFLAEIYFFT